jgi:hypothetical protein
MRLSPLRRPRLTEPHWAAIIGAVPVPVAEGCNSGVVWFCPPADTENWTGSNEAAMLCRTSAVECLCARERLGSTQRKSSPDSNERPAMQRFAIILVVCVVGCSEQSTTSSSSSPVTLSETTIGDVVLQPKNVINGKLSLLIPEGFSIMDDQMLRIKYPSERRPTLVYTNDSASVNVAIDHTDNRVRAGELSAFHKYTDGMFRNQYPSATWFKSGVFEINGRDWMILDVRTPAIDTQVRNIMVGTSLDSRLLMVSVNLTKELEGEWLAAAEGIVQSLHVTD